MLEGTKITRVLGYLLGEEELNKAMTIHSSKKNKQPIQRQEQTLLVIAFLFDLFFIFFFFFFR